MNPKDGRLCGQRIDQRAKRSGVAVVVALLGFVRLRLESVGTQRNWWSLVGRLVVENQAGQCVVDLLWTGQARTGETRVRGLEEGMLLAADRGAGHREHAEKGCR